MRKPRNRRPILRGIRLLRFELLEPRELLTAEVTGYIPPNYQSLNQMEKVAIPATGAAVASYTVLEQGVTYDVVVSGTVENEHDQLGDAQYQQRTSGSNFWLSWQDGPDSHGVQCGVVATCNGNAVISPLQWSDASQKALAIQSHVYMVQITGTGQPLVFRYVGNPYGGRIQSTLTAYIASEVHVIVSGFEPFGDNSDGTLRTVNTSETVADQVYRTAKQIPGVSIQEVIVPAVWGQPLTTINNTLAPYGKQPIDLWLAFGEESEENLFKVETVAHNARGLGISYIDNDGKIPGMTGVSTVNIPGGAATYSEQFPIADLINNLGSLGDGANVVVSTSAGNYLCEAMLYSLLYVQSTIPNELRNVVFMHVPALQSGQTAASAVVATFSKKILKAMLITEDLQKPSWNWAIGVETSGPNRRSKPGQSSL